MQRAGVEVIVALEVAASPFLSPPSGIAYVSVYVIVSAFVSALVVAY